jgi:hypothetical protein
MKLTNRHGNYAKRIKPFSDFMLKYFDVPEMETRRSVSDIAPLVRYFKPDKIYLIYLNHKLEASTKPTQQVCNIVLNTYLENNIVCCEDYIILQFPDLDTI